MVSLLSPGTPQVALGLLGHSTYDAVAELLDTYVEAGGVLVDVAWVYQDGHTESLIGQWLTRTGARNQIKLITKGAHTPHCDPVSIGRQLTESLDRLCTDYVDAYLMHRDNPEVSVSEFVDAMHREVASGRTAGPVGGSNWTMERFDAAIAAARAADQTVPSLLSNHFSLASMNSAIWPGTISSATPEWRNWLATTQVTNLAWSSQSRGFFSTKAAPDKRDDEEMVRVWYSEENFARRNRASDLGKELGWSLAQVVTAYNVSQPFPQIPVIGPDTVAELHDSLAGVVRKLSAEQLAGLDGDQKPH